MPDTQSNRARPEIKMTNSPAREPAKRQSQKKRLDFSNVRAPKEKYKVHTYAPLSIYYIKDYIAKLVTHPNFPDALATSFTLISVSFFLPFVPWQLLIILALATFLFTMLHPMVGLIFLLFETLPMFIYQAPLIAWLFTIMMSIAMVLGYKHYRILTFTYMLMALPLSFMGSLLEIPALILTVITVGFKRAVIGSMAALALVFMLSGFMNIPISGALIYNASQAHAYVTTLVPASIITPANPIVSIGSIIPSFISSLSSFFAFKTTVNIIGALFYIFIPLGFNTELIAIQLAIWLLAVIAISNYSMRSRSRYKAAESSIFAGIIIVPYIIMAYYLGLGVSFYPLIGLVAMALILFVLEFNDIEVVSALAVMKKDFRGQFGEIFEDLSTNTGETFNSIANYEETKKELKEAVLAPIENRDIAGAYNLNVPKGILLFGPPGTGKTLMMRALANEIRAGFFYVKASNIVSQYPGESARTVAKIFDTAKKHAPAILFIDEIDGIAGNRENQESESAREILSSLLGEMDGFQKIENVIIVGATNVPQLLDPSIMRPGRFDKIIYMPLPDQHARELIFKMSLKKLPISKDIDYVKLAEMTQRYSGADIKNICNEAARREAQIATEHNNVLSIEMDDMSEVIKNTKPSTSLAQIDQYNAFKMDYERRGYHESQEENSSKVTIDDVIGLDDAKKALYEAVEIPILHPDLVKKYDVKNLKGILLFGPPGTGKSMLMQAIANEIGGVKIINISGPDLIKAGPDNVVLSIKKAFDRARENAPSIIFIDEIDSIVSSRENNSEEAAKITGEFLQEMDGLGAKYQVLVVASTNFPENLDYALLRPGRFDKIIYVPPPDLSGRVALFKQNLEKAPCAMDMDYKKLAEVSNGYTGADISNICRQVKVEVLQRSIKSPEKDEVSMKDLMDRIEITKPSAPQSVISRYNIFMSRYGQR